MIALALLTLVSAAQPAASPSPDAKLYAVVVRTGPSWDPARPAASQLHFKEHSANIRRLGTEGRLALGGRFGELGMMLVRAGSEAEARALFDADPSVAAGHLPAGGERMADVRARLRRAAPGGRP